MSDKVFGKFAQLRREIEESRRAARRLKGLAIDLLRELKERDRA